MSKGKIYGSSFHCFVLFCYVVWIKVNYGGGGGLHELGRYSHWFLFEEKGDNISKLEFRILGFQQNPLIRVQILPKEYTKDAM